MKEIILLLLGIGVLILGIPLGIILARLTREELNSGKRWIKLLINLSLIGGLISLVFKNDILMFTFFFIAIISSQSLRKYPEKKEKKKAKINKAKKKK